VDIFINVLIGLAMLVVLASLGLGLSAMARGSEFSARSNAFMRWRVWAQAGAVALLLAGLAYKSSH
jgi:hypothetical protein